MAKWIIPLPFGALKWHTEILTVLCLCKTSKWWKLDWNLLFCFCVFSCSALHKDVHFALLKGSIERTLSTRPICKDRFPTLLTTAVQGGLPAVILHAFMDYQNWFCFISSLYYCNITLILSVIFFLGHWTVVIFASCALCSQIILYVVTGKHVLKSFVIYWITFYEVL